jgi:ATP-dependent exoDNAse (exonuclease V) beta subunit
VLDFVNTFFAQEDDYVPLQAMQEHASDTPATHPCPIDGVNLNGVDELRQQEARVLRAKLEQILKNNPSIEPQDCVLLLPTLSHASTYQEVLGETTPTYIYAKRGQPNALLEDILVWLGVLHLPWSKLAAWHACRLPWTYQSLQQLTQWHQQMQGLGLNKKIDDPRWQEIQALFFQHQTLLKNSCLQWAEHFVDMHRAFESSATTLMDEATLHWLIDQAYRYDTEKPSESFYTHLCQTHQLHGIAPTETTKPEGLQIMTMHQAKGLEFPVVMLGDLASGLTKTQYLYKRPYPVQVELAFSPFRSWLKTDHFDSLAQEEKKALMQEKKRLLYVAMTRAKTHLLYPTTDFAARGATFYDFFAT